MLKDKDPMGAAIADYYKNGVAGRLRVFSPDFDEDEIPVATLFRGFDEMPVIEQAALRMASGHTLDVGAGAGCHSIALQEMGKDVTAIDISPLSVQTMRNRGVEHCMEQDFWTLNGCYDTILMLMNGIGIVGTLARMDEFFSHVGSLLAPDGQLIVDSTDISYLFEDEDGNFTGFPNGKYYGQLQYQMQYKRIKGTPFPWLYIDSGTLSDIASRNGFDVEVVGQGEHYDFLARITRSKG